MKLSVKLIAFALLTASMSISIPSAHAVEYCADNGGCGYNDCCRTTSLAPAIALGTIALAAVIAVMVTNMSGSAHCHSCH